MADETGRLGGPAGQQHHQARRAGARQQRGGQRQWLGRRNCDVADRQAAEAACGAPAAAHAASGGGGRIAAIAGPPPCVRPTSAEAQAALGRPDA